MKIVFLTRTALIRKKIRTDFSHSLGWFEGVHLLFIPGQKLGQGGFIQAHNVLGDLIEGFFEHIINP